MMSAFLIIPLIILILILIKAPASKAENRGFFPARRIAALLLISTLIIPQTGCSGKAEETPTVSKDGFYLDTFCTITIYAMEGGTLDEAKAEAAIDGAFDLCAEYESLLSRTKEGSDIWNINHSEGQPVTVSPVTIDALTKAMEYCKFSGGRFDITIGHVTDLWDFHEQDEPVLPEETDVSAALETVDYHNVVIKDDTVTLRPVETAEGDVYAFVDLGGMAKGFIADAMTAYLSEQGVTGAVVDLGGNIAILGYKDGTSAEFTVGIKKPFSETGEIAEKVSAANASIVTSGVYERYFEVDGVRYHHILDGKTGYPADRGLLSATVIGPEGRSADCDALATIAMLSGELKAQELIKRKPGYTLILIRDDQSVVTY